MKKVYFACSIAGGRDHAHVYQDIVNMIKGAGGQVLSELFADTSLVSEVGTDPSITPSYIWQRDVDWVEQADGIIAEVTQPSLGVGYEIALAEKRHKPVLALFYPRPGQRLSPMVSGNPHLQVVTYESVAEVRGVVENFVHNLSAK